MNEENRMPGEENVEVPADETTGTTGTSSPAPTAVTEDDENTKYMTRAEYEQARLSQNLPVAIIAGLVAGIVCAGLWAAIALWTETIHSFMAILVGLGVGFVVRLAGKGIELKFGIVGALIAVLSCALGNFLATIGFIAADMNADYFDVLLNYDYSFMPRVMKDTFEPIDLLFYGLAIVAGFGTSFHNVKVVD